MERTARFMFAAVLSVTVLSPRSVCAMDFEQFTNMTAEDQKHYLTFMVGEARALLIETGHPDEAKRVDALFRDVFPGSGQSVGEAQFEFVVAGAQHFKNSPRTPASMRGPLQISCIPSFAGAGQQRHQAHGEFHAKVGSRQPEPCVLSEAGLATHTATIPVAAPITAPASRRRFRLHGILCRTLLICTLVFD
jgi:hypothetical protein